MIQIRFSFSGIAEDFGFSNVASETYNFEITIAGQTQSGQISLMPFMAKQNFLKIVNQIALYEMPCKVKFYQKDKIWSQLDQEWKELENSIEFMNNAYKT